MDGPIDDRDAGVVETAKGTLLVTTFISLGYASHMPQDDPERLAKWRDAHNRVSPEERKTALGMWMIRSTDGGVTWTRRYKPLVNSPHGPIQLADGRLLYAGKEQADTVAVYQSADDGKTWQRLAVIPERDGDSHKDYS